MATDTQLDLKTVLPEALDEQDACVRTLTDGLQARQGVIDAHVKRADGTEAAQLCVHFEPGVISLQRIRELALSLGARVDSDFGHLSLDVDGISRPARAQLLEQRLRAPGRRGGGPRLRHRFRRGRVPHGPDLGEGDHGRSGALRDTAARRPARSRRSTPGRCRRSRRPRSRSARPQA